jgi:hypothetical protein
MRGLKSSIKDPNEAKTLVYTSHSVAGHLEEMSVNFYEQGCPASSILVNYGSEVWLKYLKFAFSFT